MNTYNAVSDADKIQTIVAYIKEYVETEEIPDNQLGIPDYVKPLITSFGQIKEIAQEREAKLQEHSNFMSGSNRGGRRRKTRRVRKSRTRS